MRRRPPLALAALLAFAAAFAGPPAGSARADEIVTKTGQKFTGRIVREDEASYTIDTPDFGPTRISKADTANVSRTAAPPAGDTAAPAPATPPATTEAGAAPDAGAKPAAAKPPAAKRTEPEPLDAAARLEARKGLTIKRVTSPGGQAAPAAGPSAASAEPDRTAAGDEDRQAIGGAQLAATPVGTLVLVYEPPRQVTFGTTGIQIGRRTIARLDAAGRATARLAITAAAKEEPWTLRLADVQRHVLVKSANDHIRLLEGIDAGDWVRIRTADGAFHQGRLTALSGTVAKLTRTGTDGVVATEDVDIREAIRIDGLAKSVATARALQEAAVRDPIGVVLWPEGREVVGRVVEVLPSALSVDTDRDGTGETVVPFDCPASDVRRIVPKWRDLVRDLDATSAVRVRCAEDFNDARVEREWTGMVAGVTAYAVCVKTADGAAVVPFEQVVKLEHISAVHVNSARGIQRQALGLPILPGDSREALAEAGDVKGITALHDGSVVTHVWVTAPWDAPVAGIRLDAPLEDALATSQVQFTTFVTPVDPGSAARRPKKDALPRELLSESVEGLRVSIQTDDSGRVRMVEISRR